MMTRDTEGLTRSYIRGVKESTRFIWALAKVVLMTVVMAAVIFAPLIAIMAYWYFTGQWDTSSSAGVIDWVLLMSIIPWNVLVVWPAVRVLQEAGYVDIE